MATGKTNPVHDFVDFGQSKTYYPIDAASGFSGSVVIESTVDVAVISNTMATCPPRASATMSGSCKARQYQLPAGHEGNASNTSMLAVQNAGTTDAEITIHFVPETGSSYPSITDIKDTLKMGAAHIYDLSTQSNFSSVAKWVGRDRDGD